ncbi:alpha/beta hydrolase [Cellvibrio sp. UBA7671]|uniref:alpha/beta hydrolase n=1 Tax=Cellvibrio sp. UBA7671 TaxID=1946312 RepID=UPI002F350BB7
MSDSRGSQSHFDSAGRDFLRAHLPGLLFSPAADANWATDATVQAYLDFYAINFARTHTGITHGFGAIDACGFRNATHYWLPENPKGTLVVVHGYYDHVGLFGNAIEFGLQQGFAVLAFDLPGHGLSSGEQVAIDSFDHYADVLDVILTIAQKLLPAPYFALGQSTGGSVLLNYLWRYDSARPAPWLARIALCAPLILPRGWRYSGRFLYALVHSFIKRMPRGRSRNSHNPDFIRFVDELDCLQSRTLSVRWVGAMEAWDQQFRRFPPLEKSLLVIQGTDDLTVAWRYNLQQIWRALPNARIELIPGAGHQLVNESSDLRAQVFTAINRHFFGD